MKPRRSVTHAFGGSAERQVGVARWSKRSTRFFNTKYNGRLTDSKLDIDLYRIWIFLKSRHDLSARFFGYRSPGSSW